MSVFHTTDLDGNRHVHQVKFLQVNGFDYTFADYVRDHCTPAEQAEWTALEAEQTAVLDAAKANDACRSETDGNGVITITWLNDVIRNQTFAVISQERKERFNYYTNRYWQWAATQS